jgi:hypothetical protein
VTFVAIECPGRRSRFLGSPWSAKHSTPPLPLSPESAKLPNIMSAAAERITGGAKHILFVLALLVGFVPKAHALRSPDPRPSFLGAGWSPGQNPLLSEFLQNDLIFGMAKVGKGVRPWYL